MAPNIKEMSLKLPVQQLPIRILSSDLASYYHNRKVKSQMKWAAHSILRDKAFRKHLQFRKCRNRNPHCTTNKHRLSTRSDLLRLQIAALQRSFHHKRTLMPIKLCECGVSLSQSSLFLSTKTKCKRLRHLTRLVSTDTTPSSISLMKWTLWCIFITPDVQFKFTSKTNINS